uniref:Protein kinase domain-containing protein n=1 Tax=Electrophorus electricus TaxID=8005 RepID=A0A4W4HQY6_ELEEL
KAGETSPSTTDSSECSSLSLSLCSAHCLPAISPSPCLSISDFRGRFSVVRKCLQKACKKEVALVALADTYESPTAYILVLELLEGGRLLDYLVAHDELMEEKVAYFIKDTLEALQSLHTCKVAHLDLKPENLMVDLHKPAPCVKLIDFGDAVLISGHRYVHLLLGNPEFAAPELIQGMPVSLSTDVWSVGVLAYVMLSGVSPFLDESLEETCVNVCKLDFCFPDEYFHGVSQAARDFVVSALSLDPRRRPSSSTCLQHPWVGTHSADYSKTPLDTARLASFIDRRKQLHDVRPVTNIKGLVSSSMGCVTGIPCSWESDTGISQRACHFSNLLESKLKDTRPCAGKPWYTSEIRSVH